jgi:hypothetical protein
MITAEAILTLLAMLLAGSVLHRALAVRLLAINGIKIGLTGNPSEVDILILGILPALALIGTIDTYLALFHLLRADVTLALFVLLVLWRRRDTLATLGALQTLAVGGWWALKRLDVVTLTATAGFIALAAGLSVFAQLPSENIDVWVFQLPLAKSMVDHSGFVYPQMDHPSYGNMPLFFNLLFAQAMLFVDHFIAANAVNIAVYLGFLLALSSYATRARGLVFLLILFFFASFAPSAPAPLTDLSRSCFSVLALIFTDRYLSDNRSYDLVVAGLLAGAAIAGKYTELVTAALIGLVLLPRLLLLRRRTWLDALGFSAALVVVAGFWYAKNWLLLGNPIYPFIFGHPGLTDEGMAEYMRDLSQAFDPANRIYVTNLLTPAGWRDFIFILHEWFFVGQRAAQFAGAVIVVALVLRPRRMAMLVFCTAALFVFWYARMFNHIRWATPAYLLFFSTAVVGVTVIVEAVLAAWQRHGANARIAVLVAWVSRRPLLSRFLSLRLVVNALAGAVVLTVGIGSAYSFRQQGMVVLGILGSRTGIDDYLATRRQGYGIYRYIAEHDLRMVFQPLDNGAASYAAAYNGGRDGGWILGYRTMPSDEAHADEFLREQHVRYFIYRPTLNPTEIDRLGADHVGLAYGIMRSLLPKSRLLLTDPFGWSLYETNS